jgi:hemerythrin
MSSSFRAYCRLTGNPQVDGEHASLVAQCDRLERDLRQGDADDAAGTVAFLLSYVIEHFTHEEALMAEAQWPGLAEHRAIHAEFVERLEHIVQAHHTGEPGLGVAVAELLSGWLISHINTADQEWAKDLLPDTQAHAAHH